MAHETPSSPIEGFGPALSFPCEGGHIEARPGGPRPKRPYRASVELIVVSVELIEASVELIDPVFQPPDIASHFTTAT